MDRTRMTRLAFAVVLLSFLLSTAVSLWSLHMMTQHNKRELGRVLAARIYDTISIEMSEPVVVAKTMANDRFLIDVLHREGTMESSEAANLIRDYLSGIRSGLDYEAAFVVSDATRRYYTFNGLSKIVDPAHDRHDYWYADFLHGDRAYTLAVDNDQFSHDAWTVFANARVEDGDGRLLGVCGVGNRMRQSQEMFVSLEAEYQVKIDLVDTQGIIQVDTEEDRLLEPYPYEVTLGGAQDTYHYQDLEGGQFAVTKYLDSLGWYLVVRSDGTGETEQYVSVLLLNGVLCLLVMGILLAVSRGVLRRTVALTNASFRDHLTMLYNRRAFEEEKARLLRSSLKEDFVYMTADVNGLKTANDTLGHAAGDELIKGAAQCMKTCFGKYGTIYRIGGDEFAAMLNLSPAQLEKVRQAFEATVDAWSGDKVKSLSVSCGFASSREFPSENISELSRISDERMYEAKAAYYRQSGIDRRKT